MAVRDQVSIDQPTSFDMDKGDPWPINWSAVWAGALASLAAIVAFGLIGTALGVHVVGVEHRVVELWKVSLLTLAFSTFAAFLAFVIGGWVTGKIAGIMRSETAMLHGAIAWLVSVPLVVTISAVGAGSYMGGWHSNLGGHASWAAPEAAPYERPQALQATASESERAQYSAAMADYQTHMKQWKEDTPKATRNAATGALCALMMGLIGSVIGGWWASGEPMTFSHHLSRTKSGGRMRHATA